MTVGGKSCSSFCENSPALRHFLISKAGSRYARTKEKNAGHIANVEQYRTGLFYRASSLVVTLVARGWMTLASTPPPSYTYSEQTWRLQGLLHAQAVARGYPTVLFDSDHAWPQLGEPNGESTANDSSNLGYPRQP
jgi:hypothetical protein